MDGIVVIGTILVKCKGGILQLFNTVYICTFFFKIVLN